jgi:hypothetical protein
LIIIIITHLFQGWCNTIGTLLTVPFHVSVQIFVGWKKPCFKHHMNDYSILYHQQHCHDKQKMIKVKWSWYPFFINGCWRMWEQWEILWSPCAYQRWIVCNTITNHICVFLNLIVSHFHMLIMVMITLWKWETARSRIQKYDLCNKHLW